MAVSMAFISCIKIYTIQNNPNPFFLKKGFGLFKSATTD